MVTKKHFNKIAEIIRECTSTSSIESNTHAFVCKLADFFEKENPNFKRGKFIHACFNDLKK